jgi:hypothetical protein
MRQFKKGLLIEMCYGRILSKTFDECSKTPRIENESKRGTKCIQDVPELLNLNWIYKINNTFFLL